MSASQNETPGQDWMAAVRKNGTPEFAKAFSAKPKLTCSFLNGPIEGVETLSTFFSATTGGMYESLAFTAETTMGGKTFLEWTGKAFGLDIAGVNILTRDADDLIESVQIFQRPLKATARFAFELSKRLQGKLDPALLSSLNPENGI